MERPQQMDFVLTEEEGEVPDETTHLTFHRGEGHDVMTTIRSSLCDYHRVLVKVQLHKDTQFIQECAFRSCTSLKEVELSDRLKIIGKCAFTFCISLERISVPSTVEAIQHGAFWECYSLCEVKFSEGLRYIGSMAFQECISLFAVSFPRSLEMVGLLCFKSCTSLVGVEIPSSDKSPVVVGRSCFQDCTALVNTILPSRTLDNPILKGFFPNVRAMDTLLPNHLSTKSLRKRFENCPIHQACYHVSETREEELVHLTKRSSCEQPTTDGLGFTPFHILAASAILRIDLLAVLLDSYPLGLLQEKDRNGKTTIDYLLLNPSLKSIRMIQTILERIVLNPLSQWGSESWRWKMSKMIMNQEAWNGDNKVSRQRTLQKILDKYERYKRMEQTTLLELALWKLKLGVSFSGIQEQMDDMAGREAGRMTCGTDVVIPNVTLFLFQKCNFNTLCRCQSCPFDEVDPIHVTQ